MTVDEFSLSTTANDHCLSEAETWYLKFVVRKGADPIRLFFSSRPVYGQSVRDLRQKTDAYEYASAD